MRIAICDDDKKFLVGFSESVSKEFDKTGIDYSVDLFDNSSDFLKVHADFDLIFLDIDMPQTDGFTVAEQISTNNKAIFIFVTMHDELVYSSLRFRPFRFIRKSHIEAELNESITAAVKYIKKNDLSQKLIISSAGEEKSVSINHITYIEIYGHSLIIHTPDEAIETYGSLLTCEKQLSGKGFVRVHKSYLVNLSFIYSVEQKQIILDDKTVIPLSRYKSENVKNEFRNYLRSRL